MGTDTIEYPTKLVAFLDILGFRQLVLQSQDRAKAVIDSLEQSLNHGIEGLSCEEGCDWFSVKLFSDCFCISCQNTAHDLSLMLRELSFLQWHLARDGIFVRGGISVGAHYESERIIFSEGLIRAYEVQVPDPYPRVVVDDALADRIKREPSDHYKTEMLSHLLRGQDGVLFLDYLQGVAWMGAYMGDLDDLIEEHKRAVLEQVDRNRSSAKVLSKYRWVAEYHNFKFGDLYNPEDSVDGYFEQLRERLTIPLSAFPQFEKMREGDPQ